MMRKAIPCFVLQITGRAYLPQHRDEMLRRFTRMEKSRTTPGNGLGLSLVSAIADAHRASMEITDNGPGLNVKITFPGMTVAASR